MRYLSTLFVLVAIAGLADRSLAQAHAAAKPSGGPTLKETVAWIVQKINDNAKCYGTIWQKGDTTSTSIYWMHTTCFNPTDSSDYLYIAGDGFTNVTDGNGAVVNEASFCSPCTSKFVEPTFIIDMRTITSADIEPDTAKNEWYCDKIPGPVRKLVLYGKFFQQFGSNTSFHPSTPVTKIPIAFSNEKDLDTRLLKAFSHLQELYAAQYEKEHPKAKEVF